MPARKNPHYRKLNSIPRKAGEDAKKTTIWLSESEIAWLKAMGGTSPTIRGLIRREMRAQSDAGKLPEPERDKM